MKTISRLLVGLVLLTSSMFAGQFILDKAHSSIEFKVKHLVISTVVGTIKQFGGSLSFDLKSKKITSLGGKAQIQSIDTSNYKRDQHLRGNDFFDVLRYPTMSFEMIKLTGNSMDVDITIKGITKRIKFDYDLGGTIKGPRGNQRVAFELNGKINRKDFGLSWNKLLETGDAIVSNEVKININIQGVEK